MADQLPTQLTLTSKALVEAEEEAGPELDDRGEAKPPGRILAAVLADGIALRGWKTEYRWSTFTSHAFDAERAGHRYDVEVSLSDGPTGAWLVTAKPRVGFFKRVFANSVDAKEHGLLRLDLDAVLAADGRVQPGAWVVGADS